MPPQYNRAPTRLSVSAGKIMAMADENTWTLPAAWWEQAEPFRGLNQVRPEPLRPYATVHVQQLLHGNRRLVDTVLTAARDDGLHEFADAAQAYIDAPDSATATPLGAGVVLTILRWIAVGPMTESEHRREFHALFVDSWMLEHGVTFAAEAAVWQRAVSVQPARPQQGRMTAWLRAAAPGELVITGYDHAALRVRAILADASESAYRTAVQRLSELRSDPGTVWARLATSYLVPERQDWVDADLALEGLTTEHAVRMLITSLTTPAQLTRYRQIVKRVLYGPVSQWYSLFTQVGPAAVDTLATELIDAPGHPPGDVKLAASLLPHIPCDAAYQALLDHIDDKRVLPALTKATTKFPRRAMRLLSRRAVTTESPLVVRTFQLHALAKPKLVAEEADSASKSLLDPPRPLPVTAAELPAVLTDLPARAPKLPRWLPPVLLPQIRLRDTETALPESAVVQVITMLMASGPEGDHPELATVTALADPVSLSEFAWAVFDSWHLAAYPAKNGWVLHTLGRWGTEDTVRRFAPFLSSWPSNSATARAIEGLSVLAAIGGDVALMHLHTIAKKAKQATLKTRAKAMIEELSRAMDVSDEELADRAVPKTGLSAKELATVTNDQVRRFEAAMIDGRRWRACSYRALVVDHPVLGELARRLVWAVFAADGTVGGAFRVDDDRTFADVEDERFELPDDALVGIAHPMHLGEDLDRWRVLFADYELLQPFEQLDRGVYRFTPAEAASDQLPRFVDRTIPTGRLYGLRHHGWEMSYGDVKRRFGVLTYVTIVVDPGIQGGYRYEADEQRILTVRINSHFGALDAVTASELLRQLERLAA
ncbi:DUF4132 domain-containing protein [Nocardia huaxiensis]|uniref:DUF4132 domain-containing protein n=1 Tax=Nocardia huaxiensis TaxID=2755382 RepID=A0A7D6Z508_9NOCA|nr:DUF4132 domain-containing protein [Nocardia huaxiensis]QLY33066.1 DUF4132 domain-containing protein [Nocardia huaxiensis]